MEFQDLMTYVRQGDGTTTKFISTMESGDDIGPFLAGFLNTRGGRLFIGMDIKNAHLRGTDITKDWLDTFIKTHFSPSFNYGLSFVVRNDRKVAVIHVKEGQKKPYYFKDDCYIIENKRAYLLLNDHYKSLLAKRESDDLDDDQELESDMDTTDIIAEAPLVFESPLQSVPAVSEVSPTVSSEVVSSTIDSVEAVDLLISTEGSRPSQPVNTENLTPRQKKSLRFLVNNDFIKNKMYRQFYDVSHKTAHLELVDLVDRGLICQEGSGRSTCYVLNQTSKDAVQALI